MYIVTIYLCARFGHLLIVDRYWVSEDNPKTREKIIENFTDEPIFGKKSFVDGKRDYLDFSIGRERYRVTIRERDFDHYNNLKKQGKTSDMFWRYW